VRACVCGKKVVNLHPNLKRPGMEPYYPVNDDRNAALYAHYKTLADKEQNVRFGGRLAEYKYYDMAPTIEQALRLAQSELG